MGEEMAINRGPNNPRIRGLFGRCPSICRGMEASGARIPVKGSPAVISYGQMHTRSKIIPEIVNLFQAQLLPQGQNVARRQL